MPLRPRLRRHAFLHGSPSVAGKRLSHRLAIAPTARHRIRQEHGMIRKALLPRPKQRRSAEPSPTQDPEAGRERPDQPRQLRAVSRQGPRRLRRTAGRAAGHGQPAVAAHSPGRPPVARAAVRSARRARTFSTSAAAPGRSPSTCSNMPIRDAQITCCDLSPEMLRRARNRLKSTIARATSRPTCRGCRLPTKASTASPAATCWSTCPTRGPGWPNCRA